VMLPGRGVP
nr:Chain E, Fragment from molecular 2 (region containing putative polycomb protein Suz12) [Thermochaetoides thermophila DSM 1495]